MEVHPNGEKIWPDVWNGCHHAYLAENKTDPSFKELETQISQVEYQ